MKIQLDLKSAMAGSVAVVLIVALFSFRSGSNDNAAARYQAVAGAKSVMVLDTYTGAYIVAPDMNDFAKVQWVKGTFDETFKTGKDNKKVPNP